MNKKTIGIIAIIIVLIILVWGFVGYTIFNKYIAPNYRQQGIDSTILIINQNGIIPILNQTNDVNWITINNICGGLNP